MTTTSPSDPTPPRKSLLERCAREGYVPWAFNVRARCNLWRGHRGPCQFGTPAGPERPEPRGRRDL